VKQKRCGRPGSSENEVRPCNGSLNDAVWCF